MSGVNIDSVADTAPGRTPTYSRRRLHGRATAVAAVARRRLGGLVARLLEHAGGP